MYVDVNDMMNLVEGIVCFVLDVDDFVVKGNGEDIMFKCFF